MAVLFEMPDARIANVRVLSILNDWWATCADEVAEAATPQDASEVFAGMRGMCRELGLGHRGTLGGHGPALRDCLEH